MSLTAGEDDSALERAIALMSSNGCFDTNHFHSFQSVSFHSPFRSCGGCRRRFQFFGGTSSAQVVQCKACGAFAHRSCAFSKSLVWEEVCPVNQQLVQENGGSTSEESNKPPILQPLNCDKLEVHDDSSSSSNSNLDLADRGSIFRTPPRSTACNQSSTPDLIRRVVSEGGASRKRKHIGKANFPFLSASELFLKNCSSKTSDGPLNVPRRVQRSRTWHASKETERRQLDSLLDKESGFCEKDGGGTSLSNASFEWTNDGPPVHWASDNQDLLRGIPSRSNQPRQEPLIIDSAIHFASHTFSNVSRALHENIAVHFEPMMHQLLPNGRMRAFRRSGSKDDENSEGMQQLDVSRTASCESESPSVAEVEGLLTEKLDKETSNKRLGLATVAGGVAGGIAGLMFAGPVGWVIGGKVGQTAGILGVVLEGSVSIGVFASGVAAGRHAGQQLQDKMEEKRILALGDGTRQRVLLVRPNVVVNPEWEQIYANTRKSHPSGLSFDFFKSEAKSAKKERYEREVDIVKTDEEELATGDKVLLLVSRQLNNRTSLPGYIYQKLLDTIRVRAASRGQIRLIFEEPVNYPSWNEEEENDEDASGERKSAYQLRRARRQDAHAVIKYVTATLLEVRPGFSSSPAITELTATAVESLVFGEAYDLIMEEIEAAFADQDNILLAKIAEFERQQWSSDSESNRYKSNVSESALAAMHSLPEAHSVSDKLQCCTTFLERISDFFSVSNMNNINSAQSIGADSLLKLVCQHLIMAKVPGINAQIAFLEEFARDEQLLRGKEGYSLVTLQASLHFLNSSDDFVTDIFEQDDDY